MAEEVADGPSAMTSPRKSPASSTIWRPPASLLSAKNREPAGKMLDFLAQEFTREANT